MRQGLSMALLSCLCILTCQISIPLVQNTNRCMIVYTSSPDQNLILDMKFPTVLNHETNEFFKIAIINTEDKTTTEERVKSGSFRKQLDLHQSVVYKVCFAFLTNRSVGSIIVEYNAETKFSSQIETMKVPQSLLKSQDFKNTYKYAENMHLLTKSAIEFQKDKRQRQDTIYMQNKSNIDTLFWISSFQMAVILLTGIYQFFNVRNFLISKQYL